MLRKFYPLFFTFFLFSSTHLFSQNISVNTTGAANSTLSMLEVLQISATANTKGLHIAHSGAISGTGYGIWSEKTGASTTNVAGYFSASGGTNNYPGIFMGGNVGIGTTTPGAKLSFQDLNNGANTADGITWYNPSPTAYGIFRSSGAWSGPNYQQLNLAWQTGVVIDGGSLYGRSGTVLQPTTGNVGIGIGTSASPVYKLTVQGLHASSQIRLFSDEYGQGITGANTANMNLWASEPGMTWTGVGIGNNIYNTTSFPRVTTTRGGSYMRLLENQVNVNVVSSTGTDIPGLKVSTGSYGFGGIAIGQYHTLSSHSNSWLYMGDENGGIYGGRGLALANAYVASAFYYPNGTHGAGKVLTSDVNGYATWSNTSTLMQVFTNAASQTNINSSSFIDVTGLSRTITTTVPCYFIINTTGSLESQGTSGTWTGTITSLDRGGTSLTEQGNDIINSGGVNYVVTHWGINYTEALPAGTYTYKVKCRVYNGVAFYAGGATTTGLSSDGTMTIQVVPQ